MRIIVIGASHAGIAFVDAMRRHGFSGKLILIDRLTGVPLERPPLSKAFLVADAGDDDRFVLRKSDWFAANDIQLLSGMEATSLDAEARLVRTGDGQELAYDRLVLATGATPRRLAGTEGLSGVFELRHPQDASRLRAAAAKARSAVVIGGGYIGLEVAATLAKSGKAVSVVEAAPRLLARVASQPISEFFADLHSHAGSRVMTGATVTSIESDSGAVSGVTLEDGQRLETDMLVVGIGVVPEMTLAASAGIETGNGILVDDGMETSAAGIYAIGDGALRRGSARGIPPHIPPHIPPGIRIESVHNAQDSAERAAAAICGQGAPADQAPWFWSEQFDVRLQSAGIVPAAGDTVCHIRRPGKREGGFSVWSYEGDVLRAVEAVRDPAGYMLGKSCLEKGLSPTPEQVGDPAFDLKTFVAAK
ncbi:MAG: NAD(P)/FAD-dependent oxidoreductase [Candidatus Puniceispirillaceae bacterium]